MGAQQFNISQPRLVHVHVHGHAHGMREVCCRVFLCLPRRRMLPDVVSVCSQACDALMTAGPGAVHDMDRWAQRITMDVLGEAEGRPSCTMHLLYNV